MMENPEVAPVKRYPLWESCLETIRERGLLAYGSRVPMDFLVESLGCPVNSIEFGAAMSAINDEIIADGYYLSARDQGGACYLVVSPETAEHVADANVRKSFKSIRRAIKLFHGLQHNPAANLSAEAKRRLASKEEKNAVRLALMQRPMSVHNVISKEAPKTLSN